MMHLSRIATIAAGGVTLLAVLAGVSSAASESIVPEAQRLNDILERTAGQTAVFLDQFSDVKCTEQVRQEKLGKDNKVQLKEESTYDYLVILTNTGGELNLSESRIPVHEAKKDRKNTSMLLSNGFATLFLVFHPIYAGAFKFTLGGQDVIAVGWAHAGASVGDPGGQHNFNPNLLGRNQANMYTLQYWHKLDKQLTCTLTWLKR